MATVTVFTAERMQAIEDNMISITDLHSDPASMVVFGDSYVSPSAPGATLAIEGIPKRVQSLLRVPDANYINEAVSGGQACNNKVSSCYRTVWDFFNLKRTSGPYTPDCAYALIKFDTNDSILGYGVTQKRGFKGSTRSMVARCQAGSVFQSDDETVATVGGRTLLWAALASEPYRTSAHNPDKPWGSGNGCVILETVGETITIDVPADHTGFVDLFLIGAYYGGTISVAVNAVAHGTMVTGGCGVSYYGSYLTDRRNGLVYRVNDVPAGAAEIVVTVTDLEAGVVGSTGFVALDSWSIRTANANLPFVQLPEMAMPDGGLSGYWSGVNDADADEYTLWKHELADEMNAGLPAGIVAVGVPLTRGALDGFDVLIDADDLDAAGHPPRDACAGFAQLIVENYAQCISEKRQINWATSWASVVEDPAANIPIVVGNSSPIDVFDDFEAAGVIGAPWTVTSGTWTKAGGKVSRDGSTNSKIVQDTGLIDVGFTATEASAASNYHGLVFRYTDNSNYMELVQSSTYGNWLLRSIVAGVVVYSKTVYGPHISGTVIEISAVGDQISIYFNGIESSSSPKTISTNATGTFVGIRAYSSGTVEWSSFRAGVFDNAFEGQLYLDTTLGQLWGPYNADTETFPGPIDLIGSQAILDQLETVPEFHVPRIFYAGELAASQAGTALTPASSTGVRTASWVCPDGSTNGVVFGMMVPPSWNYMDLEVVWWPSTTNAGDVRFTVSSGYVADGLVDTWGYGPGVFLATANGVAKSPQRTVLYNDFPVTPNSELFICVERIGAHGEDTFTGDCNIISMKASYSAG